MSRWKIHPNFFNGEIRSTLSLSFKFKTLKWDKTIWERVCEIEFYKTGLKIEAKRPLKLRMATRSRTKYDCAFSQHPSKTAFYCTPGLNSQTKILAVRFKDSFLMSRWRQNNTTGDFSPTWSANNNPGKKIVLQKLT